MTKINFSFLRLFQLLIFILAAASSSHTQTLNQHYLDIAEKIVRTALIDQKGYKLLGELCEIGPRLSGSDGSMRAILWAKEKMENLGFDKVWLQPVMVPKWVRGNVKSAEIVESKKFAGRKLNIAAFGGSVGTKKEGIIAEVVTVNNFEELKKANGEIKNKIVFFNRSLDLGKLNTFAGYGGAVDQRTQGAIESAKFGAVGVIVRSVTTKHDNVPHVGVMSYVDSVPKIPSVAIGYLVPFQKNKLSFLLVII